jgi:hypothetical protein
MKPICANPACLRPPSGGFWSRPVSGRGVTDGERWFCSEDCRTAVVAAEVQEGFRHGQKRALRRLKLGLLLLKHNLIERDKLQVALEKQAASGRRLGEILIEAGYITGRELNTALAQQAGIAPITLEAKIPFKLAERIPPEIACTMEFVVFRYDPASKAISTAVADIDTLPYLDDFFTRAFPGHFVTFFLVERARIREILAAHWPDQAATFASPWESEPGMEPTEVLAMRCADFLHGLGAAQVKLDPQGGRVTIGAGVGKFRVDIVITPVE